MTHSSLGSAATLGSTLASPMAMAGGRRRIDRVLGGGFLDGMSGWTMAELRAKRAEAEQEEVDLSYSRRLLHGRLDLLQAEQETRRRGNRGLVAETADDMVATLAGVLADEPAPTFGMGRHSTLSPSRMGEHRRAAEAAVADVGVSDPPSLDDAGLIEALRRLHEIEQQVGEARREVQAVLDTLSGEMARRYRDGEADIDEVLSRANRTR
jgi:hypothetical protein